MKFPEPAFAVGERAAKQQDDLIFRELLAARRRGSATAARR